MNGGSRVSTWVSEVIQSQDLDLNETRLLSQDYRRALTLIHMLGIVIVQHPCLSQDKLCGVIYSPEQP